MDIKLIYAEGISKEDTIYFGGTQEQDTYFSNHTVDTVENFTYYPPHYKNSIKLNRDEFTYRDTINYLALTYSYPDDEITYYYFINKITYISENVIQLDIEMDTIQTYMFHIDIATGIIERQFINRWSSIENNEINRNYIRENVSNDDFKLESKTDITSPKDTSEWFVIGQYTDFDKTRQIAKATYNAILTNETNTERLPTTQNYGEEYIGTDVKITSYTNYILDGDKEIGSMFGFMKLNYVSEVLDLYVIPFNPFCPTEININKSTRTINYDGNVYTSEKINYEDMENIEVYYLHPRTWSKNAIKSQLVNFDFNRNTQEKVLFNKKYCPVLLDINYYNITFGTRNVNTTYPLYELTEPYIYLHYFAGITTGSRYYYINGRGAYDNNITSDPYRTMVVDGNKLSLTLRNSAWADYISSNRFRWQQLQMNNVANILSSSSAGYVKGQNAGMKAGVIGSTSEAVNSLTQQVYREKNLFYTPDTVSTFGEYSTENISQNANIFYALEVRKDIEQVAQFYHRYGYRVDKYVNNINVWYTYFKSRKYYDYIKFKDINLDITNFIQDENTINNITKRFTDGIRLWYLSSNDTDTNEIGKAYIYDNVERDYL